MATRKIIDIEQNGEKVWPKGHAKATYMSDGKTVEDAINQIGTGGDCQSPYVLPFDIETLDGLSYSDNEGRLQTDADVFEKTKSAIEMGRMVVIRYGLSDAGYHICDATYNGDAISVRVYNGLMLYSFEIYASSQGNILVEQYSLQSELVDGVNIATINGQSLTAGGDITIGGGGGSSNGRNLVSSVDLIFSEDEPLLPDTTYYCNDVVAVDISAVTPPSGDYAEYTLLFKTDEDVYITCPDNWLWANGQAPSVEGNTVYELSVVATKFGSDYIYKAVLTPFESVE